MKFHILLLTAILLASASFIQAAPVSQTRARLAAERFFGTGTKSSGQLSLVWNGLEQGTKTGMSDLAAPFYVYNRNGGGFVIISGDDDTQAVLAYSLTNSFSATSMPANLRRVMSRYSSWIDGIRKGSLPPVSTSRSTWATEAVGTKAGGTTVVVDHGTALWGQSDPYNRDCPSKGEEKTVTGCVATAMAIIMHHHKYPDCAYGNTIKAYKTESLKIDVPARQLSAYAWDSMPLKFTSSSTTLQKDAVAKLIADCGAAIQSDYNVSAPGTSAYTGDALFAFCDIFKYDRGIRYVLKSYFRYDEWLALIKSELDKGPVMYDGADYKGESRHEFVVDGYDSNDYFKYNFGWEGSGNGFYYMTDTELSFDEGAIIGITPDTNWTNVRIPRLAVEYGTFPGIDKPYCGIETSVPYIRESETFSVTIHIANVGNTDFKGTVSLKQMSKDGKVKQVLFNQNNIAIGSYYRVLVPVDNVRLTNGISEGDYLQAFYTTSKGEEAIGEGSKSTLTLRYDLPTETGLAYDKDSGKMVIAGRPGMTWTFNGKSGTLSYAYSDILDRPSSRGTYPLTISDGNTSYTVKLTF